MRLDLLGYVKDHIWAAPKSRILHWMTMDPAGIEAAQAVVAERLAGQRYAVVGSVAVVPVYGGITHRTDFWSMIFGGSSVDSVRRTLRQVAADDTVQSIVLEFDSPGGTVDGVPELADEILALRASSKRIVSHVNTMAASAAYWLATQTDEIVVSPSGEVGSIGVYSMHEDVSKMMSDMGVSVTFISAGDHKVEGNPFEPLSEDARGYIQTRVNEINGMFVSAVARGRNVSAAMVNSSFGQGRMFGAKDAVRLGMADKIATLDETVARLSSYQRAKKRMAADAQFVVDADGVQHLWSELPPVGDDPGTVSEHTLRVHGTLGGETFIDAVSEPEAVPEAVDDTDYRRTKLAIAERRQARPDAA